MLVALYRTVLLLVCIYGALRIQHCEAEQGAGGLRVGIIAPLTGPMASIGLSIQSAVRYAAQNVSEPPALIFEDDQFQPKSTVAAARKLVSGDHVEALIVFGSSTCLSVAGELERSRIPTFCLSIHDGVTKDKQYIFRFFPSSTALAEVTAREAKRKGYSRIAVVTNSTDGFLAITRKFSQAIPAHELVGTEEISPAEADLRPTVTKVSHAKPDAVFVMLLPQHFGAFVSQLLKHGYKGDIFSTIPLGNSVIQQQVRPLKSDAWYVSVDHSRCAHIAGALEKIQGNESDFEGIFGYEALRLLLSVKDRSNIPAGLRGVRNFESVFGVMSPQGQDFFPPVVVNSLAQH